MNPYLVYVFVFAVAAVWESVLGDVHVWHGAACVFFMFCAMVLVELNHLVQTLHAIGVALKEPENKA